MMVGQRTNDLPGLGGRLRQAREASGLSQEQVARLLKIPRPAVTEMERETRKVSAGELKELAEVYKVSLEWLAGDLLDQSRKVKIAARKLGALKERDLDSVMRIIDSLQRTPSND
jgi:transcriptional regulator with XRE-family HTH domain